MCRWLRGAVGISEEGSMTLGTPSFCKGVSTVHWFEGWTLARSTVKLMKMWRAMSVQLKKGRIEERGGRQQQPRL